MQKEKFSDHNMPWVVQALVDAVVELEGPITEGIFRLGGLKFRQSGELKVFGCGRAITEGIFGLGGWCCVKGEFGCVGTSGAHH